MHRVLRALALIAALCAVVGAGDGKVWPGEGKIATVTAAVGEPQRLQFALPSALDVVVSGIEKGTAYQVRLSFLGSPPVEYRIAVRQAGTGRRLQDTEMVRFVADDDSVFTLEGSTGSAGAVTLRIAASALSVVAPRDPRWAMRYAVLSVHPLVLGLVPQDVVVVGAAAVAAVLLAVAAIVPWWLRQLDATRDEINKRTE